MIEALVSRVVELSRRYAPLVCLLSLALATLSGWYAVTHFKMNTDVNQLLSADLPWRQQEMAMEKTFPQNVDTLVVVIDGDNADAAEYAAEKLTNTLDKDTRHFTWVKRPDAIPYFKKNGLLLLSKDEVTTTLDQLIQLQPMLGAIVSDPSLRGLFSTLQLMIQGYQAGQMDKDRLNKILNSVNQSVAAALQKKISPIAIQSMMTDGQPSLRDTRKFIITKPVLDYSDLESGHAATEAIRQAVKDLALPNIQVRLTGSVALNDEEFASIAEGTGTATMVSAIGVIILLFMALRSLKIIGPILITLTVGLLATTAFALLTVGSLNLISVAFAVMFIGIAVDFGIQFGVRFRDERHKAPDIINAMKGTAKRIAIPLSMAAASTAIGFLAFIPTDYRGVSELGLIAGVGMIIAFGLNITLLPALLRFTQPPAEPEAIGYQWLVPVDAYISRHSKKILIAVSVITIVGLVFATQIRFDFDPLNLKDAQTESVSTMFDLMKDPDATPYTAEFLVPSLEAAQKVAAVLEKLPEVDHAMTLGSFVPEDQDAKLAMIADTRMILQPTLDMGQQSTPTPDDNHNAATKLAEMLESIKSDNMQAGALADNLRQLASSTDDTVMQAAQQNLIAPVQGYIGIVRDLLDAQPVTVEQITNDLRDDWVTSDGRYLVKLYPKGNARDPEVLRHFTSSVRNVVADVSGVSISIQESANTITSAFIRAGLLAVIAISLLSFAILRRIRDVVLMLTPLFIAGILTLATMVVGQIPLNFANIIALPLLLSLGVSYAVYFVSYWRSGESNPLQSSMTRAVLFSAATVLTAFASLMLSAHPGTAGMGKLLTIALVYSLLSTTIVLPALLADRR
ncbi:MAG: MMPL family transporter [Alphaproteobacteria bacterium]|nr:MMPL family transporter [Alphaproteobacteria bacterium]